MRQYLTRVHVQTFLVLACLMIVDVALLYMLFSSTTLALNLLGVGDNIFVLYLDILAYLLALTFTLPITLKVGLGKPLTMYAKGYTVVISIVAVLFMFALIGLGRGMGYSCDNILGTPISDCSFGTYLVFTAVTSSLALLLPLALASAVGIFFELKAAVKKPVKHRVTSVKRHAVKPKVSPVKKRR